MLLESSPLSSILGTDNDISRRFIKYAHDYYQMRHDAPFEGIDVKVLYRALNPYDGTTEEGDDAWNRIGVVVCERGIAAMTRNGGGVSITGITKAQNPVTATASSPTALLRVLSKLMGKPLHAFVGFEARDHDSWESPERREKTKQDRVNNSIPGFNLNDDHEYEAYLRTVIKKVAPQLHKVSVQKLADTNGLAQSMLKAHNFKRAAQLTEFLHYLKRLSIELEHPDTVRHGEGDNIADIFEWSMGEVFRKQIPATYIAQGLRSRSYGAPRKSPLKKIIDEAMSEGVTYFTFKGLTLDPMVKAFLESLLKPSANLAAVIKHFSNYAFTREAMKELDEDY